jgi:O-antigen/teichoic acid export membrane protein
MDRMLLVMLASTAAVGWYAVALRVMAIPLFLPTLITMPLLPALSRSAGNPDAVASILRRGIEVILIVTIPVSAMAIALAPVLPDLLSWGEGFEQSVPLMMVLALQQPVMALDMVLGTALVALGLERKWLRVFLIAAAFNAALNAVMIPYFQMHWQNGAIGASIVTVATEVLTFLGALRLLPAGALTRSTLFVGLRITVVGVAMGLVASALVPLSLVLALGGGAATFLVLAAALGVVRMADVHAVRGVAMQFLDRRTASAGA